MSVRTARPGTDEYAQYYARYVELVPSGDIVVLLRDQIRETQRLVGPLSEDAASAAYAPDKWTIKEVVAHMADAERVISYRALRFARGDATPLPGFDEKEWAPESGANARSIRDLLAEFATVRAATVALFDGLPECAWERRGTASNVAWSVRAAACIIAGHERHHLHILETRYGLRHG